MKIKSKKTKKQKKFLIVKIEIILLLYIKLNSNMSVLPSVLPTATATATATASATALPSVTATVIPASIYETMVLSTIVAASFNNPLDISNMSDNTRNIAIYELDAIGQWLKIRYGESVVNVHKEIKKIVNTLKRGEIMEKEPGEPGEQKPLFSCLGCLSCFGSK